MANSKFLEYQDTDNSGLVDACDDLTNIPEQKTCPPCQKNINYMAPDWKTRDADEPWLNEKICKYQVTIITNESSLIPVSGDTEEDSGQHIQSLFEEYKNEAIDAILSYYEKDNSDSNIESLGTIVEFDKYDLDIRKKSKVKLLYSISYEYIDSLQDVDSEDLNTDEDTEEEQEPVPITVSYDAEEFNSNVLKVRKALNMYGTYLKVFRATEGINIVFESQNTIFNLKRYGDNGITETGTLEKVVKDIDRFLSSKGYLLRGGAAKFSGIGKDVIKQIEFSFTKNYALNKISITTQDCGDKKTTFGKKALRSLTKKGHFKDKTAMAYMSKIEDMVSQLTAREPPEWSEFVVEHTYPSVILLQNWPFNNAPESAPSCIGEALLSESKQLGQDILDLDFSLADSVLYSLNKTSCREDLQEVIRERFESGLLADPTDINSVTVVASSRESGQSSSARTIFALAKEQAFKEIELTDPAFSSLCAQILNLGEQEETNASSQSAPSPSKKELFRNFIDNLKICGLKDLLVESTNCLLASIPFEKAMASIVKSALQNMSIVNFGKFIEFLPPADQQAITQLVKAKLNSGEMFKEGSTNEKLSKYVASGTAIDEVVEIVPWEDETLLQKIGSTGTLNSTSNLSSVGANENTRTLAQTYQARSASLEQSSTVVMEAYLQAVLQHFEEDFFSVLEVLNRFPGSQLIAKAILLSDCPQPPLFHPSVMNFIRDIELPFCKGIGNITLPSMRNPLGWIPRLNDITGNASVALNFSVQKILVSILSRLLIKVCNLIGSSACQTLKSTGQMISNIASYNNRDEILVTIRESICGPDVSDRQVEITVIDMFEKLGLGAAAMADTEKLLQFTGDMASSLTRKELIDMFLGNPTDEALTVVYQIIEDEYPSYTDALPSKESIADLTKNIGNLMPVDYRREMSKFTDELAEDDYMPANPQLCATPEDIENFCAYRQGQLSSRATPSQALQMCENFQDELVEKLDDIANALQQSPAEMIKNTIQSSGPIISDPGCDNGIVPFESPVVSAAKNKSMDFVLRQMFLDFSTDMLGNGPGEKNWGLLNMILSDTMGIPLTAHYRRSFNRRGYIDFLTEESDSNDEGQFPLYVAEWLQSQLLSLNVVFDNNNDFQDKKTFIKTFDELGVGLYSPLNVLELPDFGYGVHTIVNSADQIVEIVREGRKGTPDALLQFTDNNKGRRTGENDYQNGFNLSLFLSELKEEKTENGEFVVFNIPADTARINITDLLNSNANRGSSSIQKERAFEFVSVDDTFDLPSLTQYPIFQRSFNTKADYSPQLILFNEILSQQGYTGSPEDLKVFYDSVLSSVLQEIVTEIAANENSFLYGAEYDNITEEDADYVVQAGQTDSPEGTLYSDATINGESITNDDAILGISRNQLEDRDNTRVFYLDPSQFGGSYVNPPVYIRPVQNKGWLGLIDVMFPELSPCKPSKSNLIDFDEISDQVAKTLDNIPLDERLRYDEDCVVELPYNRVLERESIAAIQGIIVAACRIYSSVHFIKSMSSFTTFKPDFKNVYSSLYPQYVVESMERDFKDAEGALWERLNPFKDEEFWYAFLEQAVQTYGRLIDEGKIVDIPDSVLAALNSINDMQERYKFPTKQDWKNSQDLSGDLGSAFKAAATGIPFSGVATFAANFETYKQHKERLNFEAIKATEEDAKVVLKEMVKIEFQYMSDKFMENLEAMNIVPKYNDIDYFILTQFTAGGIDLDLDKEIVAVINEEPTGASHGTTSNVMNHVHTYEVDAEGNGWAYTAYHPTDSRIKHKHQIINWEVQVAQSDCYPDCKEIYDNEGVGPHDHNISQMIVPIGDVESYNYDPATEQVTEAAQVAINLAKEAINVAEVAIAAAPFDETLQAALDLAIAALEQVLETFGIDVEQYFSSQKPFVIEKYISINGVKYGIEEGTEIVKANSPTLNISDVYPGTLEQVFALEPVIQEDEGAIGIRQETVEGDPSNRVVGLKGELGLRHGLQFSALVDGQKFVITSVEIDALDHEIQAFAAVQANSKELLCLIKMLKHDEKFKLVSRYIVPVNKLLSTVAIYNDMAFLKSIGEYTQEEQPGMKVIFDSNGNADYSQSTPGWAEFETRKPGFLAGLGVREWDNWDQQLLRNSKSRIKSLFRAHYNSRDFESNLESMFEFDPVEFSIAQIKQKIKPNLAKAVLPRWRRKRIRTNPFDSKGTLCEK